MKEDTQWRLRDTEGKEYIIIDSKKVDLQEELNKTIVKQQEEIEKLNNIINEFDKWLLGEQMMFYRSSDNERLIRFGETKSKWLELKGDSSNE